MAVCTHCKAEMKEGVRFCKSCGSGLAEHGADRAGKKGRVLGAEQRPRRRAALIGAAAALVIVGGVLAYSTSGGRTMSGTVRSTPSRNAQPASAYTQVRAENGEVRIPVAGLQGGTASYFMLTDGGREVRFFVLRAADGTVRAALDACSACYRAKLGYRQEGDTLVCNNCGMGFKSTDVGHRTGGCSPVPVQKREEGQLVVLNARELLDGAKYF